MYINWVNTVQYLQVIIIQIVTESSQIVFVYSVSGYLGICFSYLGEFQPKIYREKVLSWLEMFWTVGIIMLPRKYNIKIILNDILITIGNLEAASSYRRWPSVHLPLFDLKSSPMGSVISDQPILYFTSAKSYLFL